MLFRVKPHRTFSATAQAFRPHESPMNSTHADHHLPFFDHRCAMRKREILSPDHAPKLSDMLPSFGHDEFLAHVAFARIAPDATSRPHPLDARAGDQVHWIATSDDFIPSLRNPSTWEKRNAPNEQMKMRSASLLWLEFPNCADARSKAAKPLSKRVQVSQILSGYSRRILRYKSGRGGRKYPMIRSGLRTQIWMCVRSWNPAFS